MKKYRILFLLGLLQGAVCFGQGGDTIGQSRGKGGQGKDKIGGCKDMGGQGRDKKTHATSLLEELSNLYDLSRLPAYLEGCEERQVSTYDLTGGNNDGFEGTYSFIRRNPDSSLVIFDVQGCGVINRFWTLTPTDDTLDFFIDDSPVPTLSIQYTDLFSGKVFPFVAPLVGAALGGYYCYFPILFKSHCRIVCRGKKMQFHQIGYRLYPEGTVGESFSSTLDREPTAALGRIDRSWAMVPGGAESTGPAGTGGMRVGAGGAGKLLFSKRDITLLPGETKTVFSTAAGGRIVHLQLGPAAAFAGIYKDVDIRVSWDGEPNPAIDCPVADLFGYAFGEPAMKSLLIGTDDETNYCYIPMPFDRGAKIELIYRKGGKGFRKQAAIQCRLSVGYTTVKRDVAREGKLYANRAVSQLGAERSWHVLLHANGRGHYIGTILQAQGRRPGMTYFFEGDDSTAVDGKAAIHGTGSEDYFNGGWYAFPDRWDGRKSLPIHGALDYSLPLCRTGGYRFYLSDKIPFGKSIFQSMEHGPSALGIPADYTSVSFYYCDRPPASIQRPTAALSKVFVPDTLMLYPQLMKYTVWGNIGIESAWKNYQTGGTSFTYTVNDESRLKISLADLPPGEYALLGDVVRSPAGCQFAVLQGQQDRSGWMDMYAPAEERVGGMPMGTVTVDDRNQALTLVFKVKSGMDRFFLNRLIFVKKLNPPK